MLGSQSGLTRVDFDGLSERKLPPEITGILTQGAGSLGFGFTPKGKKQGESTFSLGDKSLVSKPELVCQLPQNNLKTEKCIDSESQKKDSEGYPQRRQKILTYIDSETMQKEGKGQESGKGGWSALRSRCRGSAPLQHGKAPET